jgi:hypothetical protein
MATVAIVMILLTGIHAPQTHAGRNAYFTTYASMSWREPFADKAGIGLADNLPVTADEGVIR